MDGIKAHVVFASNLVSQMHVPMKEKLTYMFSRSISGRRTSMQERLSESSVAISVNAVASVSVRLLLPLSMRLPRVTLPLSPRVTLPFSAIVATVPLSPRCIVWHCLPSVTARSCRMLASISEAVRMPLFFLLLQLYLSEARLVLLGARLACVFLVSGRRLMVLDRIGYHAKPIQNRLGGCRD